MNQKNPLGLHKSFLDTDDPIDLFKYWFNEAKKIELNDPNAFSLATSDAKGFPSVRVVLLKDYSQNGFVFYTNLESHKSTDIQNNPIGEMCFYWKSLKHQIKIFKSINKIINLIKNEDYKNVLIEIQNHPDNTNPFLLYSLSKIVLTEGKPLLSAVAKENAFESLGSVFFG